ncbi:MAG: hypothetical protein ACLFTP_09960 [Rhodosalinus sp.]
MGKKGGSAPKPPDPDKSARAEAQYNRVDTYAPSGSGVRQGYTRNGKFVQGAPKKGFQSAQQFIESPTDRAIRLLAEPASVDLTERIISDNVTNMPDAPRVQDRGTVADSIFNRTMSMLRPEIDRNNSRLLDNLQGRGIPVGAEAFNDAYGAQQRETQDTISRLAMDADIAAGQEQSRLFGLDSTARQQSIAELMAAISGQYSPIANLPSGQTQPVNYSAMVQNQYDAEMAQWSARQQQQAQTASAIGSLGAALIKSDQNVKTVEGYVDMAFAQRAVMSMPVAVWRYIEGQDDARHIGPMAQSFHAVTGLGTDTDISVIDAFGIVLAGLQAALWRISKLEHELQGGEVH